MGPRPALAEGSMETSTLRQYKGYLESSESIDMAMTLHDFAPEARA